MAMNDNDMPFTRENYLLMLVGLGIVGIGYLLMSGGGSGDPNVFNEDIFSTRRITVAPIAKKCVFPCQLTRDWSTILT